MVLAEGLCAGLPVFAADSGAIREVTAGAATMFAPGDWAGLARALADGPLSAPPGERVVHDEQLLDHLSAERAAERLGDAYDDVLGRARG